MSQVFFSYANSDREAAQSIIDAMQRTGLSVAHFDSLSPGGSFEGQIRELIDTAQCVVVLWSKAAAKSKFVGAEISQAINAWASNRLLLVALDKTELPVGLRDLPIVAPQSDSQQFDMLQLVERAKSIVQRERPEPEPSPPHESELQPLAYHPKRRRWTSAVAVFAIIATISVAVIQGVGTKLRSSFQSVSDDLGFPTFTSTPLDFSAVLLLVIGAAIGAAFVWLWPNWSNRRTERSGAESNSASSVVSLLASETDHQVFVSYSHRDGTTVEQLVKDIEQAGYKVWIDRQSPMSRRYAAPIVRAIKSSRVVALMCSENSFASDHVIREVYVAGDYKKPFIAFQLDQSEFPDDVLYFVTGFPRIPLDGFDTQRLRSELSRFVAA